MARIPLEPAVSAGGDAGRPVALSTPDSPAGAGFHALAARIVDELLPPIEMGGCTARILDLAAANLEGEQLSRASGGLPGRLRRRAGDLAVGLELQQVRVDLPSGGLDQLLGQVGVAVERRDDVGDLRRAASSRA